MSSPPKDREPSPKRPKLEPSDEEDSAKDKNGTQSLISVCKKHNMSLNDFLWSNKFNDALPPEPDVMDGNPDNEEDGGLIGKEEVHKRFFGDLGNQEMVPADLSSAQNAVAVPISFDFPAESLEKAGLTKEEMERRFLHSLATGPQTMALPGVVPTTGQSIEKAVKSAMEGIKQRFLDSLDSGTLPDADAVSLKAGAPKMMKVPRNLNENSRLAFEEIAKQRSSDNPADAVWFKACAPLTVDIPRQPNENIGLSLDEITKKRLLNNPAADAHGEAATPTQVTAGAVGKPQADLNSAMEEITRCFLANLGSRAGAPPGAQRLPDYLGADHGQAATATQVPASVVGKTDLNFNMEEINQNFIVNLGSRTGAPAGAQRLPDNFRAEHGQTSAMEEINPGFMTNLGSKPVAPARSTEAMYFPTLRCERMYNYVRDTMLCYVRRLRSLMDDNVEVELARYELKANDAWGGFLQNSFRVQELFSANELVTFHADLEEACQGTCTLVRRFRERWRACGVRYGVLRDVRERMLGGRWDVVTLIRGKHNSKHMVKDLKSAGETLVDCLDGIRDMYDLLEEIERRRLTRLA